MNDMHQELAGYHYRLVGPAPAGESAFYRPEELKSREYLHTLLLLSGPVKEQYSAYKRRQTLQAVKLLPPGADASGYTEGWEKSMSLSFVILREGSYGNHEPVCLEQPLEHHPVIGIPLMDMGAEILEKQTGSTLQQMKANLLFQELLITLLEGSTGPQESVHELAIARTVEYMERNYARSVTREQLAEVAGMSPDYYSRLFKKQHGQTPVECLTGIRLKQAKQALLSSKDSFRSIAHSVGFADEFYFSRKFRLVVGMSPSQYVRQVKSAERIVSLQHHLTGHLLALGIEPYGALVNGYYPLRLKRTREIGRLRPDLDKLAAVEPEVIFTCEIYDEQTQQKARMFEHLAQVVTIPFRDDWRTQLRKVALATGREEAGEAWLMQYELKVQRIRAALSSFTEGKTVLIVGVGDGQVCLLGRRNGGEVLYGDLGLQAPGGQEDIPLFRETRIAEIYGYNPDILLFASLHNDGSPHTVQAIREKMREITEDARWMDIKAVRAGRVYSLLEERHLYTMYTAFSHNLLLDRLFELWGTELSKI
ncbi:helix-turn-helix domain-containing protein [Paenibacillus piscarius]|uniref:helix-turn-helix domain-containing protein n=1 Tax=Paenibacillus piscarius TaxID=1089681 RepID=UPI001EE7ABFD|nr:helix-turn-helix domain-containing protein [Paenibacillus piscarius]